MSGSNRIHYSREMKRKARQLYYDPELPCYRSYRAVAKELGIRLLSTPLAKNEKDGYANPQTLQEPFHPLRN